ncbi:MAG: hypothetical protein IH618_14390 [Ignavibacteriaceae bacterium]|nr:hypothetical protein [Ignavibacteriaceae bacterium]
MKAIIISILIFFTVQAQNVWYVDRDATGANTGRNWTDAWNYLDSSSWYGNKGINWAILQPGDTVYISGGDDSTYYTKCSVRGEDNIRHTFASGNPVVITPAYHLGHNGHVYLKPPITWVNKSNIKFTGFNIFETRTNGTGFVRIGNADAGVYVDSMQTIENCHLKGKGFADGLIYMNGTKITIRNCILENEQNSLTDDQDLLTGSGGRGGNIIDGNLLIYRNDNEVTLAHRDCFQIGSQGDATPGTYAINTISNNVVINQGAVGTSWNGMMYFQNQKNLKWLVYNNIIVDEKNNTTMAGIWFGQLNSASTIQSAVVVNNTLILKGDGVQVTPITANIDTLIAKNNLIVVDTTSDKIYNLMSDALGLVKDIDYNFYAKYGGFGNTVFAYNGPTRTWTQWRGDGYDTHGDIANSINVTFTNKYDTLASGYYTEFGRGGGINLLSEYPELAYDILGNPRPTTGAWDAGALQYQGVPQNGVNLKGKIYIQGPFSSNIMSTSLNQGGFLPNSQPYNSPPWNYSGNENFNPGSNPSVVDWVLVELRSTSYPFPVVATRAALLKNNGLLLEPNGIEGVFFNNVDPGSYYIVIYHRNHLAIMSSGPVQLSSNSTLYDFTTSMNKAFGQNPMVELAAGKYGMFASDGNGDGIIDSLDYSYIYLPQRGTMGYRQGDFNMDSGVSVYDVNQFYNINEGKESQVP